MKSFFFRLPPRVTCVKDGSNILLLGPLGRVVVKCKSNFVQVSGTLAFSKPLNSQELCCLKQGLYGISLSYVLILVLHGVGYKVDKVDNTIVLKLGYSHMHFIPIPEVINIKCIKNEIHMRSSHLVRLNYFASSLRKLRFPDSYKGRGVLYKNELIRVKEGKKT
ncbi:unnamed protein product [Dictyota dichotoma]|uniref:Ribosomal protein L6 n=1 Tax=Dictyota dichotoma TaxID=2876 RepID=Q2TUD2_DICDH|nr:ribosomal protein L6 [Dictyota dichotoma]AAS79064.1 ribosomal protein L6 [Dictyota dichotoma]